MPISTATPDATPEHPLRGDKERLQTIVRLMAFTIQKKLRRGLPGFTGFAGSARGVAEALPGTGVSAEDVLAVAVADLLEQTGEPESWEALATLIATRRSDDALRRWGLSDGRGGWRPRVVSGDRPTTHDDDETTLLAIAADRTEDPAETAARNLLVVEMVEITRDLFSERDLRIFWRLETKSMTQEAVAAEIGDISRERVGQIYRRCQRRLDEHTRYQQLLAELHQGGRP